jgi:hypothetical protein
MLTISPKQVVPITVSFTDSFGLSTCPDAKVTASVSNPRVLKLIRVDDTQFQIEGVRKGKSRVTITSRVNGKMLRRWSVIQVSSAVQVYRSKALLKVAQ